MQIIRVPLVVVWPRRQLHYRPRPAVDPAADAAVFERVQAALAAVGSKGGLPRVVAVEYAPGRPPPEVLARVEPVRRVAGWYTATVLLPPTWPVAWFATDFADALAGGDLVTPRGGDLVGYLRGEGAVVKEGDAWVVPYTNRWPRHDRD